MMKVSCLKVGELRCNCYLIEKDNNCLLVDPGDEYDKILEFIKDKNIKGILITHGHFDHIGCVEQLVHNFHYPVYQKDNLQEGKIKLSTFEFEVIYTFGHSMDSITYYFKEDKVMFTGDFLFFDTIGRCDLDGSDYNVMLESIEKIKQYDDDIKVYPGHGESTNLGREKTNNPYFQIGSEL